MAPPRTPPAGSGFTYTPPPKKDSAPSAGSAVAAILRKAPGWRPYVGAVKNAAQRWGVDPAQLLALLVFENRKAAAGARSQAGALGLAQILDRSVDRSLNPEQYETFVAQFGGDITPEKAQDVSFALNYAAWRMAGGVRAYGDLDSWYKGRGGRGKPRGYNPGFAGVGPSTVLKAAGVGHYQPTIPQSPAQQAGASVDTAAARAQLTANWAVLRGGKVRFVRSPEPPKDTVKLYGQPVQQEQFLQLWSHINSFYQSYVGRDARGAEVANVLKKGWGDYALASALSSSPEFFKGPTWKSKAPGYLGLAREIMGDAAVKPGRYRDLVRKAIIQSWDAAAFASALRKRPEYVSESVEFKTRTAQLRNVYQRIMGTPDAGAMTSIKEMALGGWSNDQFAAALRGDPNLYKFGSEYQAKMLSLLEQLGYITGQQAILREAKPGEAATASTVGAPDSERIPGSPSVSPNNSLVPELR